MNWNEELLTSAVWILKAYGITVLAFAITTLTLARSTNWGRQFWQLTGAYFSPKRNWRPLAGLAIILLMTLCAVRIDVLFSSWYNGMYTALQNLDEKGFWLGMWVFSSLAVSHVVRSLLNFYLQQRFSIHWREWLNERLLSLWLENQAYYRTLHLPQPADNPDQRIQQDVAGFVSTSLSLSMGVVNAIVSTIAFTSILWGLSGTLAAFRLTIPRGMVFAVYLYVLIATVFAVKIGRPLISLNFLSEKLNADYRYALVRLREYAESIAFYVGEAVEGFILRGTFGRIIENAWRIVYRSLKFQGFNFIASQTAVVFPFIIQANRFFSKQISLGDMIQTAQAFGSLQDNLSYFRTAYDEFAGYRATLNRLAGFTEAIDTANTLPRASILNEDQRICTRHLMVNKPDGTTLLDALNLELNATDSLLIRGPSGSGKTTLLRSIAGLWPYSHGTIIRPEKNLIFLSQRPYLPLGSLRDALIYPAAVTSHTRDAVEKALMDVQLGALAQRLDEVADWSRILSLGEQQRLAFGRLLLAKPEAAFLDEATSAMDEELEYAMYHLLRERLPHCILISVGHRSTLLAHHKTQLSLQGHGGWTLSAT